MTNQQPGLVLGMHGLMQIPEQMTEWQITMEEVKEKSIDLMEESDEATIRSCH